MNHELREEVQPPLTVNPAEEKFRKIASWVALVFMLSICLIVFIAFVKYTRTDQFWIPIAKEHFAAVVGLPMAALASLCIVVILRISTGPLEFEG